MPRNRRNISQEPAWPGSTEAVGTMDALAATEHFSEADLITSNDFAGYTEAGHPDSVDAVAILTGLAASGSRATALVGGESPTRILTQLSSASANHLPLLVHHACINSDVATGAAHDAFLSAREAGCFMLFAANAQEVLDLTLVGHRIAEQALIPGLCGNDAFAGPHDLCTVRMPERELVQDYLGKPSDVIDTPTAAQRLLFGDKRRRIPCLIDVARPLGLGARLDPTAASKTLAGQGVFFSDELENVASRAFADFAAATGREYEPVSPYRADDADYLVIAFGSVTGRLAAVIDELRAKHQKVGLLSIRVLRPFPGAALSRWIRDKKCITVVESVRTPWAQDPPLLTDIRAVLDRCTENGLAPSDERPYPGYEPIDSRLRRPALYSSISQRAADASYDDLRAIFQNMMPSGAGVRSYHLGVRFGVEEGTRIPALERLSQLLEAGYKGLSLRGIKSLRHAPRRDQAATVVQIVGLADMNVNSAGETLARAIFKSLGGYVESRPASTPDNRFQPEACTIVYDPHGNVETRAEGRVNVLAVARLQMITDFRLLESVAQNGFVIISSTDTPEQLWDRLPHRHKSVVRERSLTLQLVPAFRIAQDTASDDWAKSSLELQSLAGSVIPLVASVAGCNSDTLREDYLKVLADGWLSGDLLLGSMLKALEEGSTSTTGVDWTSFSASEGPAQKESSAPWTVRDLPVHDDTVYDAGRFWNTVGYLYETGRADDTLTDPYVASGLLPGRTGAFRSWAPFTGQLPRFLPENCTACSKCFVSCPDSALPVSVCSAAELIADAMSRVEASGTDLPQLRRLEKHLVTQAHRLAAGDERHEFVTLGDLIAAAHDRLVARMDVDEAEAIQIKAQADTVAESARTFPISLTEPFFTMPENQEKSTGLLFSINVNADACKACGICATVCPENAMEMTASTPELLAQYRRNWDAAMRLPPAAPDRIGKSIKEDAPLTHAYRLLDRRSYHSVIGGDSAFPGSGSRATLHLIAAIADSIVRPKLQSFLSTIDDTLERLKEAIRELVTRSMEINDFEEFGRRLREVKSDLLDAESLAAIKGGVHNEIDKNRLIQLNDAVSSLTELRGRWRVQLSGGSTAMAVAFSSHSDVNSASYPYNSFSFPWINVPRGATTAVAEGLFRGVGTELLQDLRRLRKARMILDNTLESSADEIPDIIDWSDLSDEEWEMCPPICSFVQDQAEAIACLQDAHLPVKIFLLDTSSFLDGEPSRLPLLPISRPDVFMMRSTIGVPEHLLPGLLAGFSSRRPSLFHLYVSEPATDGMPANESMDIMRLAVESRAFPVLTYDPNADTEWARRWNVSGNPAPADDWLLRNNGDAELSAISKPPTPLTVADWAVRLGRFRRYFRHVPRNSWHGGMIALPEYLLLEAGEREGRRPYVEVMTSDSKVARVEVEPPLVDATESALESWRFIQELGALRSSLVETVSARLEERFARDQDQLQKRMAAEYASQLDTERMSFASTLQHQLTEELLALSGYGADSERAHATLAAAAEIATEEADHDGDGADSPADLAE